MSEDDLKISEANHLRTCEDFQSFWKVSEYFHGGPEDF